MIWAVTNGHLDDVPVAKIKTFETGFTLKQLSQAGVRVFAYLSGKEILLDTPTDKFVPVDGGPYGEIVSGFDRRMLHKPTSSSRARRWTPASTR